MNEDNTQEMQSSVVQMQKSRYSDTMARLRLDTKELIYKVQNYLTGRTIQLLQTPDGEYKEVEVKFKEPVLNNTGVYEVLQWIEMILNVQVVQGNFETKDEYYAYVADIRKDLSRHIMLNIYEWAYNGDVYTLERSYGGIVHEVMGMIELFVSRAMFNKERESYGETLIERNTYSPEKKKGILSWMK